MEEKSLVECENNEGEFGDSFPKNREIRSKKTPNFSITKPKAMMPMHVLIQER